MDSRTALFATRAPGWSILVRLLIEGAGAWSLDARLVARRPAPGG
jgi:hypothetical protein